MRFFAIDVETANADYSSICQIGIAKFQDGEVIDRWSTLVNPNDYFDSYNTSIHGISESEVEGAPTFDRIYVDLQTRLKGQITVHHMPFDRVAINRACLRYDLTVIEARWLDSANIARRTWEEVAYKGYGLANLTKHLGIQFKHHDALEDAIAAAQVVHQACELTGLNIEDWFERIGKPIFTYQGGSTTIKLDGNTEGPLYGENLVFTGSLSLPRREMGTIAAKLGCTVANSVNKKTSILVVGTQDSSRLGGYEKSSKHRKAEDLLDKGVPIRILSENDFAEMCNTLDLNELG